MNVRRMLGSRPGLRRCAQRARWVLGRIFMRCARRLGARNDRVFFSSFKGGGYNDSPRAVSQALHDLCPAAQIVWQFLPGCGQEAPAYVRRVRAHSLRALWMIATAAALVDNFNRPHYMLKFSGQYLVQTWHGDRAFKKVLLDAFPDAPFPDGAQIDLAVAGSQYGLRQFRSAFGYKGEVLMEGLPRNDLLLSPPPGRREAVRRALGVDARTRMLLYAPTFRDGTRGKKQPCAFDMEAALARLAQATGQRWIAFVRGHEQNTGVECACATDVSAYPEMAELLLAADMLITDYSSCAGDFLLTGRPVILYQERTERYDRGLYFAVEDSPWRVATSQQELFWWFDHLDGAAQNDRAVLKFYGACETGRSAEAVARRIAGRLEGTKKR